MWDPPVSFRSRIPSLCLRFCVCLSSEFRPFVQTQLLVLNSFWLFQKNFCCCQEKTKKKQKMKSLSIRHQKPLSQTGHTAAWSIFFLFFFNSFVYMMSKNSDNRWVDTVDKFTLMCLQNHTQIFSSLLVWVETDVGRGSEAMWSCTRTKTRKHKGH